MITSEVQRTLVKSPPELWSELSDPASLARHLGELGEIRITRVDPEERVEWETTGASGTVAITPSGWGTRVTLTVQHEAPAQDQDAPSTPEPASGPLPVEAAAAPQDSEPTPVEAATELGESEPTPVEAQTAPEDAPDAQPEAGAAPDAFAEPEPVDVAVPQPEPAPAGMAVPESEPEPKPEPADVAVPEPVTGLARWAAAVDAERGAPHGPETKADFESETAPVATDEHELHLHEAPAEQELPRPGLFARIFRRRRRPAASETSADYLAPGGEDHRAEAPDAHEPDANTDAETSTLDAESDVNAHADADDHAEALANTDAETSTIQTHAAADTRSPDATAAEATQHEPQPDESDAGGEHAAQRGAEEVTAVLTGVLDRLGAAHHRPFSRG
jgi:hypothetical protein